MKLCFFLLHIAVDPAADALCAPGGPLVQNFANSHDPGHTADEDVEIAGKAVAQGGHLHKLCHEFIRIHAPLQVNGDLQAFLTGLITHIGDLPDLAALDQLRHFIDDGFHRGGVGDLQHLDDVFLFEILPFGAYLKGAAACAVDGFQLSAVIDQLTAGWKIGGDQRA